MVLFRLRVDQRRGWTLATCNLLMQLCDVVRLPALPSRMWAAFLIPWIRVDDRRLATRNGASLRCRSQTQLPPFDFYEDTNYLLGRLPSCTV